MIFCVEDDDNIRELVIYTLETTGLEARGFADGTAFMEALAFDTPELVLLDIMLPGEDGLEILKKLKNSSKTKDIPVIMVTAKGSEYDKVVGLDSGADDYVTKPFGMMELISRVLQVPESEITGIKCLKTGMTNKSFLFRVHDKSYICRIPGPGTELLINRKQEKAVYDAVKDYGITEHVVYMNGETGYKISEYYEGARNSDPRNWDDVARCMALVEKLHDSKLHVDHSFDIRERITFYEALCRGYEKKLFEDYPEVKSHMMTLLDRLDRLNRPKVLSHIDSVCDNFLFLPNGDLRLIDWEYSGMCDPLIDVSMCAIYSYYNDLEVEKLITTYLHREPTAEERFVYYAYIALGGFLWCLWAVYKSSLGEEFGDYTIVMYRYAKRFYKKIITAPEFLGIGDGGTLR